MTRRRKDRRPSLIRRLVYLAMLLLSGGGAGGWIFKDYPQVQVLWNLVMGEAPDRGAGADPVAAIEKQVVDRLRPAESFSEPGTYQVTIRQVHLDPNLFRAGHTVDIQARVLKQDERGRTTTLWDTTRYGERLAVAGKDALIAEWEHDPFQVEWSPGDRISVEVYDRRAGLLSQPGRFLMERPASEPREFPLKPGSFPLQAEARKTDPRVDPRNVNIVLESRRVGGLRSNGPDRAPPATASRADDADTIVIK